MALLDTMRSEVRGGNRQLSIFQVMPRGMHFGAGAATSIDLSIRDLVAFSRFRARTKVFAEDVDAAFPGFRLDRLPTAGGATTLRRVNHVAKAARQEKPDVIVVQQHLPTAAAIAWRLPHIPVILHTHNFQKAYARNGSPIERIRHAARKRRYLRLSGIIHVSEACRDAFGRDWGETALPNCVINNGLDFSSWRPAAARSHEVLYAGRCAPEKGVLEVAQALTTILPRHPAWRARFILSAIDAHPEYYAAIQRTVALLGERVTIEVQRPFDDVKRAFESAALAVVPSHCAESFGRTALEAHAGGAALISSGRGGLAEVSGDTCLRLAEITPVTIATALEVLINHNAQRHRLAQEGAEWVRAHFDIKAQAARSDAFLTSLLDGANARRRRL